jgi:hypothetical protein
MTLMYACASPPLARGQDELGPSAEHWRQDLRYLAEQMPLKHKSLFHTMSDAEFQRRDPALELALTTSTPLTIEETLEKAPGGLDGALAAHKAYVGDRSIGTCLTRNAASIQLPTNSLRKNVCRTRL